MKNSNTNFATVGRRTPEELIALLMSQPPMEAPVSGSVKEVRDHLLMFHYRANVWWGFDPMGDSDFWYIDSIDDEGHYRRFLGVSKEELDALFGISEEDEEELA